MKHSFSKILLIVLVLSFFLTSCNSGNNANNNSAMVDGKIACVLGVGGLGDQSFNDLVYDGLKHAKEELKVDFDYAEPKQISDFEIIIRDLASSGKYNAIICVGFDQVDPLTKLSAEFPNQKFALIDGVIDAPNVTNYVSKEEEGSFLVGALSGLLKKEATSNNLNDSNKIGFVGALDIPLIEKFGAGYEAGAKYVNKDIDVLVDYVGGSNPFSDTTTAKEISISQKNKGADIIYHAAGGSGLGVFQAAKEENFLSIGCNSNQNNIDPDHIVASMLKRVDTAAYEIAKSAVIDKNMEGGKIVVLGLSDEGVDYTLEKSNIKVSDSIIAELKTIKEEIIAKKYVVPEIFADVPSFLSNNIYK